MDTKLKRRDTSGISKYLVPPESFILGRYDVIPECWENGNYDYYFDCIACEILVLWPGMEPMPPAVEVQSLNQWTSRKSWKWVLYNGSRKLISAQWKTFNCQRMDLLQKVIQKLLVMMYGKNNLGEFFWVNIHVKFTSLAIFKCNREVGPFLLISWKK